MDSLAVVNVVGHLDFGRELDLDATADLLSNNDYVKRVRYEPGDNNWLQTWFRTKNQDTSRYVSFYRSGTAIITGCQSEQEFTDLSDRVIDAMEPVVLNHVERSIRNIVATGDIGDSIDLSQVAVSLGLEATEYEPEQFPGLIYRDQQRDCVFLLFASGRIVCTGLDNSIETSNALREFTLEVSE